MSARAAGDQPAVGGVVCLPVVVVGGCDVVPGLGEHAAGLEVGLARVCLGSFLGVVDCGGRGLLLGDGYAQLVGRVISGPASRSLAAFYAARRAPRGSAPATSARAWLLHPLPLGSAAQQLFYTRVSAGTSPTVALPGRDEGSEGPFGVRDIGSEVRIGVAAGGAAQQGAVARQPQHQQHVVGGEGRGRLQRGMGRHDDRPAVNETTVCVHVSRIATCRLLLLL